MLPLLLTIFALLLFYNSPRTAISVSQEHPKAIRDNLVAAVTYFHNHIHQMNYAFYSDWHYPIGSGVTEAACKTVIKQRLRCSGMRWKETDAAVVLSLRTLVLTATRWSQFWHKLNNMVFLSLCKYHIEVASVEVVFLLGHSTRLSPACVSRWSKQQAYHQVSSFSLISLSFRG